MNSNLVSKKSKQNLAEREIALYHRFETLCTAELLQGKNLLEIANSLELSELTVRFYLQNLQQRIELALK